MIRIKTAMFIVCAPAMAIAAPHYGLNDIGTFGLGETWNFNQYSFIINDSNDQYSARFTAMEDIQVDRVFQRYVGLSGALTGSGTTAKVSIIKDNGSGEPSSNPLDVVTTTTATISDGINPVSFPAANLVHGNVYHVVTQGQTVNKPITIFQNPVDNAIRPYDRAVDPNMSIVRRDANDGYFGDVWVQYGLDPYFYFANGSDSNVVGGPGHPYIFPSATGSYTQGDGGAKVGQRFVITDKEVPAGMTVGVKQITFSAIADDRDNNGMENLIIHLRKADGTILASTFMTKAMMDNTNRLLNLDQLAELQQGVPYLLTTEVGGSGGTASDFYFLNTLLGNTGSGPATWGGTVDGLTVYSSTNAWTSYNTYAADWDLVFSFQAQVPEPASATALIGAIALVLADARRRRRAR